MPTFSDIDWGEDDGTGDEGLRNYFVEIPEFKSAIKGDIRYIIGRKGTGKSAIAEKIRLESAQRYDWFFSDLSLKDFPLSLFRSLEDKSHKGKAKYVPAWTFLICIRLISLILDDNSFIGTDRNVLQQFMDKNFPGDNLGFVDIIRYVTSRQAKLTIPNAADFGLSGSTEQQVTLHYQTVTDSLIRLINNACSDSLFFMLFDELDEDFSAGDPSIRLILLSLFRAIENLYKEFNKNSNINFRPLLLLRSDIFDSLRDNDLNKLDDYVFRLNWSKYAGSQYDLKSVVEARIIASLQNPNATWEHVANDRGQNRPGYMQSLWHFMLNRTYERPRDIIKFLKICGRKNVSAKLDADGVKSAEFDYSNWLFRELDNEIYAHEPIWDKAAMLISSIGVNTFDRCDLEEQFKNDSVVADYLELNDKKPIQLIETLFDFGILGTIEPVSKRWIFRYKDHLLPFNKDAKLIVHYGLLKKFRLRVISVQSLQ